MIWFACVLFASVSATAGAGIGREHVIGGSLTHIIDKHFQVSLSAMDRHFCSGVVIRPRHIITTADCLWTYHGVPLEFIKVRVASTTRHSHGWVHNIKETAISKDFNAASFDCDIAMIILEADLIYSLALRDIPLTFPGKGPNPGEILLYSGWGGTKEEEYDNFSETLQQGRVTFIDSKTCSEVYKWLRRPITENMICGGTGTWGGGPAIHRGDAGGPVTSESSDRLYGLISWGDPHYPSVFTNLASPKVRSFIESFVKPLLPNR